MSNAQTGSHDVSWLPGQAGSQVADAQVKAFLDYDRVFSADTMSASRFLRCHVQEQRPVHLVGFCADWLACKTWTPESLARKAGDLEVPLKIYDATGRVGTIKQPIADYAAILVQDEQVDAEAPDRTMPPYCHDIPIFSMVDGLIADCSPFPVDFLPPFYRANWWQFAQFFMGPKGSLTPMHFDTLRTHNLFFQIAGRKRFTIIPADQVDFCGRRGWRWFDLDPENIDTIRFPAFQHIEPIEIIVGPGDLLYLPPGTLHHVRSLDQSISFNIDYHTSGSVLRALRSINDGMPRRNVYYNTILALGLVLGIPERALFPFYSSYLNYLS
jgi:hypothetical protein